MVQYLQFRILEFPLTGTIFHSYVKLSEGVVVLLEIGWLDQIRWSFRLDHSRSRYEPCRAGMINYNNTNSINRHTPSPKHQPSIIYGPKVYNSHVAHPGQRWVTTLHQSVMVTVPTKTIQPPIMLKKMMPKNTLIVTIPYIYIYILTVPGSFTSCWMVNITKHIQWLNPC